MSGKERISTYGGRLNAYTNPDIAYLNKKLGPARTNALVQSFKEPEAQLCLAAYVYSSKSNSSEFNPYSLAPKYRDAANASIKDDILVKMLADSEIAATDTAEARRLIATLRDLLNPTAKIPRENLVDEIDKRFSSNLEAPRRTIIAGETPDFSRLMDIQEKVMQAWIKEIFKDFGEDSKGARVLWSILYTIIRYLNKDLAQPNGSSTATGDE